MEIRTEQFKELAEEELKNDYARSFLALIPPFLSTLRDESLNSFQEPLNAGKYGASIKAETISKLPELLEEFEKNAIRNGAKVIWARDAEEANEFVLYLAKKNKIKYVTKGKSMVTEELGLNEVLIKNGIETYESDLGELIIQLLECPPFHLVAPALNIPVEKISEIFLEKGLIQQPESDPQILGKAAREYLRGKFQNLEMGITGINLAVAETGTIINVENEGNIRLTKSAPRIQVSIMTLEKVVPKMEDAVYLLRLLSRNCTAQKMTSYITMDSGPKKENEIDGPEELYIVIVDNNRSDKFFDKNIRIAFQCIRCGACQNICPVFTKIGGYSYGWAYGGPIGQVLNPILLGLDKTQDLYRACTSCGRCKEVCPGGLDHPEIFKYFRKKDVEGDENYKSKKRPFSEARFFDLWSWGISGKRNWNLGVKLSRPIINRTISKGTFRKFVKPLDSWMIHRELPEIAEKTFHELWKDLKEE